MVAAVQRAILDVYGTDYDPPDGSRLRDCIHVDDLARAHVMAVKLLLAGSTGLAVNLGSGRCVSVFELAAAVERITGRKEPLNLLPRRCAPLPTLL